MQPLFTSMQEIVIRAHDVDAAAERLGEIFDGPIDAMTTEPLEGIEIVHRGVWIGNERIALVGDLHKSGPVSKALERKGEGVHEICVRTRNLAEAIAHFKAKGVRLTRDKPYVLKNYEYAGEIFAEVHIVFIHPGSCHGVLVEVQEWHKEVPGTAAPSPAPAAPEKRKAAENPLFTAMQEIVIRAHDVDAAATRLGEVFDGPIDGMTTEPLEGIEIVHRGVWIGNERIALVGDLHKSGPVSKALERKGEGVHEICVRTRNLAEAIAHFKAKGVRLTRDKPYVLKNYEYAGEIFAEVHIVFIHPESCYGVLVEVQEWHKDAPQA